MPPLKFVLFVPNMVSFMQPLMPYYKEKVVLNVRVNIKRRKILLMNLRK